MRRSRFSRASTTASRDFLLKSRGIAAGWIGHWPHETPAELAETKKAGKETPQSALWLSWVELFRDLGPEMTGRKSPTPFSNKQRVGR
jgi:hypothetical protein